MTRVLAALLLMSAACAGLSRRGNPDEPRGSAIILRGADLTTNLLDGIRTRIPGTHVTYVRGGCPRILFRGRRSVDQFGTPSVYVDGTLTVDTCVLTTIPVTDIDRVEVYPSGNTSRGDVRPNPSGVIFVYRVTR